MLQIMHVMAYLGLFSMVSQAFGSMDDNFAMVQFGTNSSRPQIHSFYGLVTMNKLDDKIFSDPERLKLFGDINTRYRGYTPLHILINRSDATIQQVKTLFKCGADLDIPAVIDIPGRRRQIWGADKINFIFTGETPEEYSENRHFKQHSGNPEVRYYIFEKMLKQKIKKTIDPVQLKNKREKESEEFFIEPSPRVQDNWPEMSDDEAREHLKASIKDQKEFELFVSNLPSGAFDVFLSMQKMT